MIVDELEAAGREIDELRAERNGIVEGLGIVEERWPGIIKALAAAASPTPPTVGAHGEAASDAVRDAFGWWNTKYETFHRNRVPGEDSERTRDMIESGELLPVYAAPTQPEPARGGGEAALSALRAARTSRFTGGYVPACYAFVRDHGAYIEALLATPPAERVNPEAVRWECRGCSTVTGGWTGWELCEGGAQQAAELRRIGGYELRALGVIEPGGERGDNPNGPKDWSHGRPVAEKADGERCESGDPECGPVTHHDSEGVPLCDECWADLCADSENAGLIDPAAPQEDRGHG